MRLLSASTARPIVKDRATSIARRRRRDQSAGSSRSRARLPGHRAGVARRHARDRVGGDRAERGDVRQDDRNARTPSPPAAEGESPPPRTTGESAGRAPRTRPASRRQDGSKVVGVRRAEGALGVGERHLARAVEPDGAALAPQLGRRPRARRGSPCLGFERADDPDRRRRPRPIAARARRERSSPRGSPAESRGTSPG